jgi:hypothetical protein
LATQPHFLADPEFGAKNPQSQLSQLKDLGPSYAQRYRIFWERMIARKFYDGACFIVTNEAMRDRPENHKCIFEALSGERFLNLLLRHVTAYYPD